MTYKIIKSEEMNKFEHPFGLVYEIPNRNHSETLNTALVQIKDDKKHYHKKATEIYYVLKGAGTIELNEETFEITAGCAIIIYPLTKHRVKAFREPLEILVAPSPAYAPADEFFD